MCLYLGMKNRYFHFFLQRAMDILVEHFYNDGVEHCECVR